MLFLFKSWMQSVWSGSAIISSELKTHQESSVEVNFKFEVSDKSGIKLLKRSIYNDRDCMERRNVKKWRYESYKLTV